MHPSGSTTSETLVSPNTRSPGTASASTPAVKQEPSDVSVSGSSPKQSKSEVTLPSEPNEAKSSEKGASADENGRKRKNFRRKHRNSHLGCGTCKKRRIKCDEMLPQCFNCVKGKLHCAYLNLDAPARNALRMAQFNQNLRGDASEEATASYYKEFHNDLQQPAAAAPIHSIPHVAMLQQVSPIGSVLNGAASVPIQVPVGQPQEYYSAGYIPYQIVPQMVNGASPSAAAPSGSIVPSVYHPMVQIQQQLSSSGKPTMVYSQVPLQVVPTGQIPHVVYQPQDPQLAIHGPPGPRKSSLVHIAPSGSSMEGLPVMVLNNHPDSIYERSPNMQSSGISMGMAPISAAQHIAAPAVAQVPRSYPPGVSMMSLGMAPSPIIHQVPQPGPYQPVGTLQQLSPVPQIAATPQLTQLHQIPQSAQMIHHQASVAAAAGSPTAKPVISPSGVLYTSPLPLAETLIGRSSHGSMAAPRRDLNLVKMKSEFVKSEFSNDFEKRAQAGSNERKYSTESPLSLNETEKIPSIKMLLS